MGQPSTSQVQYGLTTGYGSTTTLDSNLVTSHSVPLTRLAADTLYHFRVISTNTNGTSTSSDYTFNTVGPPIITNVQSTAITNNGATITWTTDVGASTRVEYGLTTSYGSFSPVNNALVTSHSVALSSLTQNTLYHYRVISSNTNGTRTSGDYSFTTAGPPTITNPQATSITATSAVITWTTSSATNGTANYGTSSSYGSTATDSNPSTTSHSVTLSPLTASTTYHYQCVSTNAYGTAQTTDLTFATTAVATETIIDNTDSGWTNTGNSSGWTSGSYTGVPRIGSNYVYYAGDGTTTESSTTRKCRWTPNLPAAGTYDVYAFYQIGTNRNTQAPYVTHYNGGQITSIQNQYGSTTASGWYLVGQDRPFLAGTAGYLELTTLSTDTKLVSADAAKWVLKALADSTPPVMASVTTSAYSTSTASLNGSWSASDPESGIQRYEYAVGSTSGGIDAKGWTSAGTATSALITGLSLTNGGTYYVSARAVNGVNLTSTAMSSSGALVDATAPVVSGVTDDKYTISTTNLYASWSATDTESGIKRYEYAIGTTSGGTNTKGWTNAEMATSLPISGLSLSTGTTYYISVRAVNNVDLTSAALPSGGVTVAQSVADIAHAKGLENDKPIYLPTRSVSAAFSGRFYIEETNAGTKRSSGIYVESSEVVAPDQEVEVFGRLGLIDGYERAIKNTKVVTYGIMGTTVQPILMTTRDLGGEAFNIFTNGIAGAFGVNNIGLLVTIIGTVTDKQTGYIYVDDGYAIDDGTGHVGVRVDTTGLMTPPNKDQHVIITGISTAYNTGTAYVRFIRPRGATIIAYD